MHINRATLYFHLDLHIRLVILSVIVEPVPSRIVQLKSILKITSVKLNQITLFTLAPKLINRRAGSSLKQKVVTVCQI